MLKYGLLALLLIASATGGLAQTPPKKGANGGMVVTSQGHPIEFVLKGQELVFYLSDDDGSPLATKDMQARATVQDGGKTATVPLQPAAPNLLVGKVEAPLGSKARVAFSASFRQKTHTHTLTARYVTE
jgi:hypothetical protein